MLEPHTAVPVCQVLDGSPVAKTAEWADNPRVIYSLQRAFVAVEARKAELLAREDILPAHYALMMNIRAHPGVIGAELARLVGVTPQNVAGLVARLIERGLLVRHAHERHSHVLELHLTPAGRRRLQRADELVAGLEDHLRFVLGPDKVAHLNSDLAELRNAVVAVDHGGT